MHKFTLTTWHLTLHERIDGKATYIDHTSSLHGNITCKNMNSQLELRYAVTIKLRSS
jgi:hypothetical protein